MYNNKFKSKAGKGINEIIFKPGCIVHPDILKDALFDAYMNHSSVRTINDEGNIIDEDDEVYIQNDKMIVVHIFEVKDVELKKAGK